jgi:hypothetical protein
MTEIPTDGTATHPESNDFGFSSNNSDSDMGTNYGGFETGNNGHNSGSETFSNNFESYQAEPAGMPNDNGFDASNYGYEMSGTPDFSAPATDFGTASDGTTASDYLYTDTSFDVQPVETSVTAEDQAYNAQYNADYADYYQDQADIAYDTAVDYAEHGDYDAAEVYADSYESHQTAADDWAGME